MTHLVGSNDEGWAEGCSTVAGWMALEFGWKMMDKNNPGIPGSVIVIYDHMETGEARVWYEWVGINGVWVGRHKR